MILLAGLSLLIVIGIIVMPVLVLVFWREVSNKKRLIRGLLLVEALLFFTNFGMESFFNSHEAAGFETKPWLIAGIGFLVVWFFYSLFFHKYSFMKENQKTAITTKGSSVIQPDMLIIAEGNAFYDAVLHNWEIWCEKLNQRGKAGIAFMAIGESEHFPKKKCLIFTVSEPCNNSIVFYRLLNDLQEKAHPIIETI